MKAAQGKAECQRQNRVEVTGKTQLGTGEGPSTSDQNGELRVAWQVIYCFCPRPTHTCSQLCLLPARGSVMFVDNYLEIRGYPGLSLLFYSWRNNG